MGISRRKVNFILDADIRSFFDSVSPSWLVRFLEHRIGDRRILRLIPKGLKAAVLEDRIVTSSEMVTGQGSVTSPLLANIDLHDVFDLWAKRWRQHEATGDMIILRFADDLVVGFEQEADARRFRDEMRKRFEDFALSLHPATTQLLEFGRFAISNRAGRGLGKPETFNFLGFTLICGRSRWGNFVIRRKTRRDRLRTKLKEIKGELRRRRHQPIPEQGEWLRQVVTGYFGYHAVPTNGPVLGIFRHHVMRLWVRALRRRSQKDRFEWRRAEKLANDWLPKPRILHPWPQDRFVARHSKSEPSAGVKLAGSCPGGLGGTRVPTEIVKDQRQELQVFILEDPWASTIGRC